MNDTSNSDTSEPRRKRTLSIKPSSRSGTVQQSFSHGRTNSVVVEKRKRRIVKPGETKPEADAATPAPAAAPATPANDGLSDAEREARAAALRDAQEREGVERAEAEARAKEEARKAEEEERARLQREEEERKEQERLKLEAEAAAAAAAKAASKSGGAAPDAEAAAPARRAATPAPKREEEERKRPAPAKPTPRTSERRRGKLTVTSALNDDDGGSGRGRSLAAMRRRQEKAKRAQQSGPREKIAREVTIPEAITIQELANRMAERSVDVIKILMQQGQMLKINDVIDADTAQLVAEELGHTVKRVSESDVEEGLFDDIDDSDADTPRPPVVTIMGHVDHGKTSLLDAIRNANVVAGEAGGITQHIGAYQVEHNGAKISFIDTPGHEAFTAMRSRGAKATDVVILVVAADDGVMPTTIEAINHTRAAEVPMIVAINKIDKPDADPNRVRTELLQHEIVVESMGGDVLEVEVSALKGTNLDGLLEAIQLQSEVLELKANPARAAQGTVIEAELDKGRGPVATVLVQTGTLRKGDIVVAGNAWARVRALIDDHNEQVDEAEPSKPVEVLGFQSTPSAGDRFAVVENEAQAREITEYRIRQQRDKAVVATGVARGSLEQMMNRLQESELQEFPLLIKGDVQGSVEAIIGALDKLGTEEVKARVIHSGVGGITESDITLAEASEAAVIAFNVRANAQARQASEQAGIEIRQYNVIYDLVDDVKAAMSGMLSPERRETFLGNAEILEIFNISKVGKIAGCRVTEGTVERGANVRLIRDDVVIHEGKLGTLKRFKDDAKSVVAGQECGMNFENYQDMKAGDVIECYRVEEIARTL